MKRFLVFVLLVAIFLAGLYAWTRRHRFIRSQAPTSAVLPVLDPNDVRVLSEIDRENTHVVNSVLPSVVSITTLKHVSTGLIDLNEFVRNHRLVTTSQNLLSLGSGVIVSTQGYILTNYHVIADTDKIQAQLNDGRVEPAEVIGTDAATDIAVLKINATNLSALPLGNSDEVKVGQTVFAVGNPLGLQGTVTHGIISAKSRVVDETRLEYFQTDAAINEGNSGGPLVDLRGEVIGINTRIASQAQGLSFAIPSNVARSTMEAILKHGHVVHSYLGIKFPTESAPQSGAGQTGGVLVLEIAPGSPAEKAGIKPGDVITKLNDGQLAGSLDLRNRLVDIPVGANVTIEVRHADGKTETLTAQITAQPPESNPPQPVSAAANILVGVQVAEIPEDRRPAIPDAIKGVIVTGIDPASAIGKISGSLKPGDVIEQIDQQRVTSVAEFDQVAKELPSGAKQALFFVYRDGAQLEIVVTTP